MNLSKAYKQIYWTRNQQKRDGWERKYVLLVKQLLNKQYKLLSDRIDSTNYRDTELPNKIIEREPIEKLMVNLYTTVGVSFAKEQYQRLKAESQDIYFKEANPEDKWVTYMGNYARLKAGERITSIAKNSREQAVKLIRTILEISTDKGWGADETAREIRKSLLKDGQELNQWRALRIARTEIVTASNQGAMAGAKELGMPMEKFWISTYDSRTRDTHLVMEEQNPKAMDENFKVGEYDMDSPGDPKGGAEETINCRCTIAFGVKQ